MTAKITRFDTNQTPNISNMAFMNAHSDPVLYASTACARKMPALHNPRNVATTSTIELTLLR
jgi:hypothetical protein